MENFLINYLRECAHLVIDKRSGSKNLKFILFTFIIYLDLITYKIKNKNMQGNFSLKRDCIKKKKKCFFLSIGTQNLQSELSHKKKLQHFNNPQISLPRCG